MFNNKKVTSDKYPQLPSNKTFGLFFSILFLFVSIFLFFSQFYFFSILFIFLAFIFLLFSIFNSEKLFFLNLLWMRLGLVIGKFVSPIVLGFIFFGVFSPIGLLMKLFGRDELNLKLNCKKTYWKKYKSIKVDIDHFKNQF